MNLHNNEAGRRVSLNFSQFYQFFKYYLYFETLKPIYCSYAIQLFYFQALRGQMEIVCKCHGVSGSCSIRVCWRRMGPFRNVGVAIKHRFDGAANVR